MGPSTLRCREIPSTESLSRLGQMPRLPAPLLALALGGATALLLVSCGGEDAQLLPGETAREITANLDTVKQLAGEGDCIGAESAVQQVGEQIEALGGIDRKLKQALEAAAARLEEVIASCEESTTEAISPAIISPESEDETEEPPAKKGKEKEEKTKEPKEEQTTPEPPATPPSLPPQANGEGKGLEKGNGPPPSSEEGSDEEGPASGGVGPGSPAGGEEE